MYKLGIDIGSTTVKVVVLDDSHKILFSDYRASSFAISYW